MQTCARACNAIDVAGFTLQHSTTPDNIFASAIDKCCVYVFMTSYISGALAFQVQPISGPPSYSQHTPRLCSAVAGKRNKRACVCVCVSTLIDYRCTAGLVGYSRQWKWARTPLRKQDISNTHTHRANTHVQWLQTQAQCDFIERRLSDAGL